MVTSNDCLKKYGQPSAKGKWMTMWDIPFELEIGMIPRRIYCNKDLIKPLSKAFNNLIERCNEVNGNSYVEEIKTWDGCFNIRPKRGYEKKYEAAMKAGNIELAVSYLSLHSYAIAVDINAFENGLHQKPKLSAGFVKCFTDAGFDWGGNFKSRIDGMHFQLAKI